MSLLKQFSSSERVKKLSKIIHRITDKNRKYRFMHVCGTHENSITRFGIRDIIPENVEVIAGPGCPVCICPPSDIDLAIKLTENYKDVIVTTFGDMLKVPAKISLEEAKAKGGNIKVVYGIHDAVKLAKKNPDKEVCFFAVGFETTACTTASVIYENPPSNFSIISSHRLIPPAVSALFYTQGITLDGYLLPGHVITVMGYEEYEELAKKYNYAMAIAGFEPVDILLGIKSLIEQTNDKNFHVYNAYKRAVKREGNVVAKKLINEVFVPEDASWRGIGVIKESGLKLKGRYEKYDALKKFDISPDPDIEDIKPGCVCDKIMLGILTPKDCPLFGKGCTPEKPYGPCMVSHEGTCSVWYKFKRF